MPKTYLDLGFEPDPQPTPIIIQAPAPRRQTDWVKVALIAIVIGTVVWMLWPYRGVIPTPGPDPVVIDGGPAVLFALDGDRNITRDQAQVAISQLVQRFADENSIEYRRYDMGDDLSREDELWQKMMEAAKEKRHPAMVTVNKDGRGNINNIPDDVRDAIEAIDKLD